MGKIITEDYTIKQVMGYIVDGKYNIPRFQRDFVWPAKKIVNLAVSIGNDFPIGIFTTYNNNNESNLGGRNKVIDILVKNTYKPGADLVVDGQQRMTSIAIIYFAPQLAESIKNKTFKGDKKTASKITKVLKDIAFYDSAFIVITDLIEMLEEEGHSKAKAKSIANKYTIGIPEINNSVKEKIGEFNLFFHKLSEWTMKEIIDIFSRMNSKVKALTHVDLMNGSFFNISDDSFDLLSFIDESNKKWSNFGQIKNELFVLLMKIYSDFKLDSLYKTKYGSDELIVWSQDETKVNSFIENQHLFKEMVSKTISVFNRKVNIFKMNDIPKEVYFLAVFSILTKLNDTDQRFTNVLNKTIQHITKRLLKGEYASSPNAKALEDINNYVMKLIDNENPKEFNYGDTAQLLQSAFSELTYKKKNSALFKIVLSILASESPRNLFDDSLVPVQPNEVHNAKVDIHHFIPKESPLNKEYRLGDKIDCVGNLVLLTEDENRKNIKNKDIDIYLKESKENISTNFDKTLNSHFYDFEEINDLIECYRKNQNSVTIHNSYDRLIQDKETKIKNIIKKRFLGIE